MTAGLIASTSQVLWRILEAKGVDPAPVFQRARLDPDWWHQPYARFPNDKLDEAWHIATELTGDACIGLHAAKFINPASLNALGFAWLASDSLYDALSRLVRYFDVIAEGSKADLALVNDVCRLSIEHTSVNGRAAPQRMDAFWAGLLALARLVTFDGVSPARLQLRRPTPACVDEYYALFRCPIDFDATKDKIEFSREVAQQPLPTANRALAHANDEIIRQYLARIGARDLPGQVKSRLLDTLPSGDCSEAHIARSLNLSSRTLQRRLAEEGVSFKALLDEARHELALRFIGERRFSIKETSYLLGFSEPANFSRAFRRWTGTSPTEFLAARCPADALERPDP
jgi:AraC-like DNA-binding protein